FKYRLLLAFTITQADRFCNSHRKVDRFLRSSVINDFAIEVFNAFKYRLLLAFTITQADRFCNSHRKVDRFLRSSVI
ncbi:hypothetical protein V5H41_28930, partial [Salmonella enterica]